MPKCYDNIQNLVIFGAQEIKLSAKNLDSGISS